MRSGLRASEQAIDCVGLIIGHYRVRGETVKSEEYCALLADGLKPVIRMKRTFVSNSKSAARLCLSAYG
jgi:hypothetical protein